MIAKAKSISHGGKAIDYALKKEKSEVIDKHYLIGDNGAEIKKEFKIFQNLNDRCNRNDLSIVLSPEPSDGKVLNNDQYRKIANDYLKSMQLDKHQSIVIKHNDRSHTHLHIFVNRIDFNGNAYKDNFISKKSQEVADKIAKSRDLISAKDVALNKKIATKSLRNEIYKHHKEVLKKGIKNFKEYESLMSSKGVKILPTINKSNRLQGFRVSFKGLNLKATEVNRLMSLSKMKFLKIKEQDKGLSL